MSFRRSQYAAIARLRWRMFVNGLCRKGGKGDVVALAILLPIFALFALAISLAAGAGGFFFIQSARPERIAWLLWGVFILCQVLNINLGQPSTTFDPTQLIRFPLSVSDYVFIRLFFGMLSPANVVAMMTSMALAIGIIAAEPSLWFYALVALAIFALVNLLFTRMVFAWVDRWLSTRRAREVFTGLIVFASLGIQYLNFTYNPAYHHHRSLNTQHAAATFQSIGRYESWLRALPPELTANSLVAGLHGHPAVFAVETLGCALFGALFLAIFAKRMHTEFRGETLSESAGGFSFRKPARRDIAPVRPAGAASTHLAAQANGKAPAAAISPAVHPLATAAPRPGLNSTLAAVMTKEFLYLRRNIGLFYGLLTPLVLIYLFLGRMIAHTTSPWVFPTALAYGLLGVVPVSYNSFGLDGTGAQLYFFGPLRLRDVLLAKNIFNTALAFVETVVVLVLISFLARPPALLLILDCALWLFTTLFVELTVGNYRAIDAPKRIDFARSAQKQAAPMSAFLAMGILAVSGAIFYALNVLAASAGLPWLCTLVLAILLPIAGWIYWRNLETMDLYAATRRDSLFAELGKKT